MGLIEIDILAFFHLCDARRVMLELVPGPNDTKELLGGHESICQKCNGDIV